MANQIFNAMGGNKGGNFFQQVQRFRQQMGNVNPREMLNNLVSSGKVSQQQLDAVQQQAQQIAGMFGQGNSHN